MKKQSLLLVLLALIVTGCGGARRPDPGTPARLYGALGAARFTEGDLLGALAEYRKASAAAARADLPLERARYRFNTGRIHYELGNSDSAATAFAAAFADFAFYRDTACASRAAGYLALLNARAGRYDSAFAWYRRGRPAELRGNAGTAFWLVVQARICITNGRMAEAAGYCDRARECYRKEKMHGGVAQADYCRAIIDFSAGRYGDACTALASSLAALDRVSERHSRWRVLLASAATAFCLGDDEAGTRYYARASACAPPGTASLPPLDSVRTCPAAWWVH